MSARGIEDQKRVIESIMKHVGIYTYQHPARLPKCEMNDWHLSAAITAMISLQCTYSSIGFALNLSFATISFHVHQAHELAEHCVFFGAALECYEKAGFESLTHHENAVRSA